MRNLVLLLSFVAGTYAAPVAHAGNGSNYLHLINGLDYFFGKTPPAGNFVGIWRCFPSSILHAPTLDTNPLNPTFGTYATRLCAIHVTITASALSTISFPTIALSSSAGKCNFLTSAGTTNFGLFSVPGLGIVVAGPLTGNGGPVPVVNLLVGIAGTSIPSPTTGPNQIVQLAISLVGVLGLPAVPEGDSLVLWIQDDPNQFGAGTMQYWTASGDEQNLCSGYSFLFSGSSGLAFSFAPSFEWSVGLGTLDATLTTTTASLALPFDAGSGSRTVSITGGGIVPPRLGLAVYDEASLTGTSRLGAANCMGFNLAGATCDDRSPTFVSLSAGGPGGPVLGAAIPEMPRSVGKIDACTNALLGNPTWVAATNHNTFPGALTVPWFPFPAGNSGSNASGVNGGFTLPIPPLTVLIGAQLYFWSWPVDPTNSFLDFNVNGGHSNTNGYDVIFFP